MPSSLKLLRAPTKTEMYRNGAMVTPWELYFASVTSKATNFYGTRAERLELDPAVPGTGRMIFDPGTVPDGSLWIETDTNFVLQAHNAIRSSAGVITTPAAWVIVQGSSGVYQRTQAQLAALAALLGTAETGALVEVTDFRHILRWTGTAWEWGPGEDGGHAIHLMPVDPDPTTGWGLCDGTTYSYLRKDGTTANFATPDLIGAGAEAFMRLGDTVAGPTAAVASGFTQPTISVAATGVSTQSATTGVSTGGPSGTTDATLIGTPVASGSHTHSITDTGHSHGVTDPTHSHTASAGAVDATGEPRKYTGRPWFRR